MLHALLAVGVLVAASPTDAEQARADFERGAVLYRDGAFRAALEAFEAAQARRPAPEALFNIARCHERLDEPAEAVDAYAAYLVQRPDAPDRIAVEARITELRSRIPLESSLGVSVEPTGPVRIDDGPPQDAPVSVRVPPGRHRVRATREGFVPIEREVELAPGARVQLELSLVPVPSPPLTQAPEGAVRDRVRPLSRRGERRWTWVAAGLAGASLVAGVTFGLSARSAQETLRSGPTPRSQEAVQQIYDTARVRGTAANAFYAASAVTAAAALALFFVEPRLGGDPEPRE